MTISSTDNRVSYAGNGSTTAFAVSYPFFAEDELLVIVETDSDGSEDEQTLTTDYTVSGGEGSTGTVTMVTAPASGETLHIIRDTEAVQETDLVNNSAMDAETLEDALDRRAMREQRLFEHIERALRVPETEAALSRLPKADDRKNTLFYFNSSTGLPDLKTAADLGLTASATSGETLASYSALKSKDVSGLSDGDSLFVVSRSSVGDGGYGWFTWRSGDQSANITADPGEGVWVPPDSDATGASGAWERLFTGAVDIRWFGAVSGTDCTTAIQNALNYGHPDVFIPEGSWQHTGLTIGSDTHRAGHPHIFGVLNDNGTGIAGRASQLLCTATSGAAITCEKSPTIRNLTMTLNGGSYNDGTFTWSGDTVTALELDQDALIEGVHFTNFERCVESASGGTGNYIKLTNCIFDRCKFGVVVNGHTSYNVQVSQCRASFVTNMFLGAFSGLFGSLHVEQSSFENFDKVMDNALLSSFSDCYFETDSTNATRMFGVRSNEAIYLVGNTFFMKQLDFCVRSISSPCRIYSAGNVFRGDDASASGSIAFNLPTSGDVVLVGDKLHQSQQTDADYVANPETQILEQFTVHHPVTPGGHDWAAYSNRTFHGRSYTNARVSQSVPASSNVSLSSNRVPAGATWATVLLDDANLSVEMDRGDGTFVTLLQGTSSAQSVTVPLGTLSARVANSDGASAHSFSAWYTT